MKTLLREVIKPTRKMRILLKYLPLLKAEATKIFVWSTLFYTKSYSRHFWFHWCQIQQVWNPKEETSSFTFSFDICLLSNPFPFIGIKVKTFSSISYWKDFRINSSEISIVLLLGIKCTIFQNPLHLSDALVSDPSNSAFINSSDPLARPSMAPASEGFLRNPENHGFF